MKNAGQHECDIGHVHQAEDVKLADIFEHSHQSTGIGGEGVRSLPDKKSEESL